MPLHHLASRVLALLLLTVCALAAPLPGQAAKTLIVAHDSHYPPFSYLDEQGKPSGLLIELWQVFGEKNKMQVEFRLVDWQESIDMVRSGKADVHGGLFFSKSRAEFFDFGPKIMDMSTRLFLNSDASVNFDEDRSLEVGVVSGGLEEAFMRQNHPSHPLITFGDNENMIKAALNGDFKAFVADYPIATYYLHSLHGEEQFRVGPELYHNTLRPAVRRGEKRLRALLEDGWKRISEADQRRIQQKWFRTETRTPGWLWPSLIWGIAGLLLVLTLSYNIVLRLTLKKRTKSLNDAVKELSEANSKLEYLATHDPLTGIPNRRMFMNQAHSELLRCHRYGRPLSLVLIDLDRFKAVNDTYGHAVGDQVLVGFCELVSSMVRSPDVFARYGGEEFALLLPETTMDHATAVAERICQRVHSTSFDTDSGPVRISMSAGVAMALYKGTAILSEAEGHAALDTMLKRADKALYAAKRSGRNRVSSYVPTSE